MIRKVLITRNFGDEGVELENVFTKEDKDSKGNKELSFKDIGDLISGGSVCIATSRLSNECIETCKRISGRSRVYILLGDETENKDLGSIKGVCYIRLGLKQKGSVCIYRNGSEFTSWLFPDGDMRCGVKLNEKETDIQYTTFCKLFWTTEGLTEYYSQDQTQPEKARKNNAIEYVHTYDLASLPKEYSNAVRSEIGDWNGVGSLFPISNYSKMIGIVPDGSKYAGTAIVLSDDKQNDISDVWKYSNETYLVENNNEPAFSVIYDDSSSIFLPSVISDETVNWTSKRKPKDANDYVSGFSGWWKLHRSMRLKDLVSKKIRSLDQPTDIKEVGKERLKSLRVEAKDIDVFYGYNEKTPELIERTSFTWSSLYGTVNFEFEIHPPMLPSDAAKDPIYGRWKEADVKWKKALEELTTSLDKRKTAIGPEKDHEMKSKEFRQAILAINQQIQESIDEIERLSGINLGTFSAAQRNKETDSYKKLFDKVTALEKSYDKAQYVEEETRNRKMKIPDVERGIKDKEGELEQIKKDESKKKDLESELKSLKESKEPEKTKSKISEIETEIARISRENKRKDSIERDLSSKRSQLENLKKPIKEDGGELAKILKIHEGRKPTIFEFPLEDLPSEELGCEIYSHNNSRYLAFGENSEEKILRSEKAKNEAGRMNAKICIRG